MPIKTMHSSYKSILKGLSSALLLCLLMFGGSTNIHASQRMRIYQPRIHRQARHHKRRNRRAQFRHQNNRKTIRKTKRNARRNVRCHRRHNWFRDGLSNRQLSARSWVAWHESGHRWRVLSYGHRCIGYFQLAPAYLGYRHGRVNLSHAHQVKVADAYAKSRYGSWVGAKCFWQAHNWY